MRWDKPAARECLTLLQSLASRVKVSGLGLRSRTSDASQLEGRKPNLHQRSSKKGRICE